MFAVVQDANVTVNCNMYAMICREEDSDEWEQFTGGQPSPSPEFPQEIEVPNGEVVVKSCGKNLLNPNDFKEGGIDNSNGQETSGSLIISKDFSKMLPNTKYSLTHSAANGLRIFFYDENKEHISNKLYGIGNSTFTAEPNVRFYKIKSSDGYLGLNNSKMQLELGDATPFEPYKETTVTIPVTDFAGINGVRNEIVKYADGSGKCIQRIKKIVMDGVNNLFTSKSGSTKNTVYMRKTTDIKRPKSSSDIGNAISTRFITVSATVGYSNSVVGMYLERDYTNIYFGFGLDSELTTVELANAWLVENPFEVYYELETPIITPLTAEEITEIEKLHTFAPITNVSNDADCGMQVTYYTAKEADMLNQSYYTSKKNEKDISVIQKELRETTFKVDTIIDKADLGIKNTASGEDIHVTDSANAKVKEFALYGKAKQNTTSGKNKLPYPYLDSTKTQNGITFTLNEDGSVTIDGAPTAVTFFNFIGSWSSTENFLEIGEKYILTAPKVSGMSVQCSYNAVAVAKAFSTDVEFDNTNGISGAYIRVESGTFDNVTIYPMIRLASVVDDTWEPPTNGPSPNPKYPQEIEVPSGEVVVKSCGKNKVKNELIDYSKYGLNYHVNDDKSISISGTNTYDGTVVSNEFGYTLLKKGTYILNGCKDGSTSTHRLNVYNRNKKLLAQQLNEDVTFIIEEEKEEVRLAIAVSKGKTIDTIFYPMISLEGGEYEPYKETTTTIPVIELAGIKVDSGGNYTDSNGQQWIANEIVKYADGSGEKIQNVYGERLTKTSASTTNAQGLFATDIPTTLPFKSMKTEKSVMCNLFSVPLYTSWDSKTPCITSRTNDVSLRIFWHNEVKNQTQANEFLANNEVIAYYILATPIRTPLTAEEIAEIEKLSTFYQVTNISNDADCGMKVTYLADSKLYIDNRLAQIEQALVNNI